MVLFFAHIPFVLNTTFIATPTERLQQHPILFTMNHTYRQGRIKLTRGHEQSCDCEAPKRFAQLRSVSHALVLSLQQNRSKLIRFGTLQRQLGVIMHSGSSGVRRKCSLERVSFNGIWRSFALFALFVTSKFYVIAMFQIQRFVRSLLT